MLLWAQLATLFCVNMPLAARVAALLPVAFLSGCASLGVSGRLGGSMMVTVAHPVVLKLESVDPVNVELVLWNRGPGDVRFEQTAPGSTEMIKGVLRAKGRDFEWAARTTHLELTMTVAEGEATIGYVVRSDGGVSMTMGAR